MCFLIDGSASYEALREKLLLAITEGATGFGCESKFFERNLFHPMDTELVFFGFFSRLISFLSACLVDDFLSLKKLLFYHLSVADHVSSFFLFSFLSPNEYLNAPFLSLPIESNIITCVLL